MASVTVHRDLGSFSMPCCFRAIQYNKTAIFQNKLLSEEQEQLKQSFFCGLGQCLIPQFSGMNVLSIHTTHAPAMPSSWVSSQYKNASIGGVMGLISWKFKN